mgnify:CR=1 FL=1
MDSKIFVQMNNISKSFGEIKANDNVNLTVRQGEIHAILGENGAGKSTLMNILSGIYAPDSGSIYIKGKQVDFNSPKEPIKMGIGMIHQHFKLVNVLTAKENIIIGQKGRIFINSKKLTEEITNISEKFGLDIDSEQKVYDMSVSQKQTLEIIKVLYRGADILVLDEPTAVLTPLEIKKLFEIIRKMKQQGCAVIIITHKLNEVMEISDKVTILRKGQSIKTVNTNDTTISELTELMIGKSVDLSIKREEVKKRNLLLQIDSLTVKNNENINVLENVSLNMFSGEILGVAGVAGSGQKELCEAITGLNKIHGGKIIFGGENIVGKTPYEIMQLGIRMGFVPEDRLGMGLVSSMDIVHNLVLKDYHNQPGVLLKKNHLVEKADNIVNNLEIQTPSIHHPVSQLSGGNIQKVLIGREIASEPKVLITAYPVRGIDIGASYKIYDLLNEQKKKGVGILFIGEDLDVLLELCDRILVLYNGKINKIVDAYKTTKDEIGLLMAGGTL